MQKCELYSAVITLKDDELRVKFKDNISVEIGEAIKLINTALEMLDGKWFYLMVDARDILSSMDHSSRKYIAEHEEFNAQNYAQAIVVNNMPIRLLANFYLKFYSHPNPVKVFSKMDEGEKWLKSVAIHA